MSPVGINGGCSRAIQGYSIGEVAKFWQVKSGHKNIGKFSYKQQLTGPSTKGAEVCFNNQYYHVIMLHLSTHMCFEPHCMLYSGIMPHFLFTLNVIKMDPVPLEIPFWDVKFCFKYEPKNIQKNPL